MGQLPPCRHLGWHHVRDGRQAPTSPAENSSEGEELDFTPPCPEPDGGWPVASTTLEQFQAFSTAAQEPSDFAAMWVDQRNHPADPGRDVYTVAYTGDPDAHRAALEAIWPGRSASFDFRAPSMS